MAEAKKCPVDRGKLQIGLECCRLAKCGVCPYSKSSCDAELMDDALAYIAYLEEQLEVTGL